MSLVHKARTDGCCCLLCLACPDGARHTAGATTIVRAVVRANVTAATVDYEGNLRDQIMTKDTSWIVCHKMYPRYDSCRVYTYSYVNICGTLTLCFFEHTASVWYVRVSLLWYESFDSILSTYVRMTLRIRMTAKWHFVPPKQCQSSWS